MNQFQRSLLVVLALTFGFSLNAMEVTKVKGKKILIQLDEQSVSIGDQFFVLNPDGKRKGLVTIQQVRDDRAIANLLKGTAETGWTLQKRITKKSRSEPSEESASNSGVPHAKAYYGLLIGMSLSSMSIQEGNGGGTTGLNGSSFSFKGMFDYELFHRIWFRGTAGYQGLTANGSNANEPCGASCSVNISYLTFDFLGRYIFSDGYYRPWVGGGFSLVFPMAKSSNDLLESSISNTTIITIAGGMDVFLNSNFFIPLQAEYGIMPNSASVSAHIITGRLGAGFTF